MAVLPFVLGAIATHVGAGLSKQFWLDEKRDFEASERDRQSQDLIDLMMPHDLQSEEGRFGAAQSLLQNVETADLGATMLGQNVQQQGAFDRQVLSGDQAMNRQLVQGAQAMDRQRQQQQFQLQQLRDQQAVAAATQQIDPATGAPSGRYLPEGPGGIKLGTGMMWDTQLQRAVAAPGTDKFRTAQNDFDQISTMVGNMRDLRDAFEAEGFETGGIGSDNELSGKQAQRFRALLAAVAKVDNKGVLQQGELEQLLKDMPDPTSTGITSSNTKTLASYDQILEQLEVMEQSVRDQYEGWQINRMDPAKRLLARRQAEEGLTPPPPERRRRLR